MQKKLDVHQAVTDQIIAAIEAGAGTWQMPWHRSGEGLNRPINIDTGNHYRGVNIVALWASAQMRGFSTGTWGTYRQWVRRVSRMKGVTDESMSSVQLCRHVLRAMPVTVSCEAGTKAQGGQPAIGEIRARRRSDG